MNYENYTLRSHKKVGPAKFKAAEGWIDPCWIVESCKLKSIRRLCSGRGLIGSYQVGLEATVLPLVRNNCL
jgi:hypothetical protein